VDERVPRWVRCLLCQARFSIRAAGRDARTLCRTRCQRPRGEVRTGRIMATNGVIFTRPGFKPVAKVDGAEFVLVGWLQPIFAHRKQGGLTGCGKTPLSFRGCPLGPGPEPRDTGQAIDFSSQCSWIPGSRATPAPRNDRIPACFRILLETGKAALDLTPRVERTAYARSAQRCRRSPKCAAWSPDSLSSGSCEKQKRWRIVGKILPTDNSAAIRLFSLLIPLFGGKNSAVLQRSGISLGPEANQ
jgi:hypothetical protein